MQTFSTKDPAALAAYRAAIRAQRDYLERTWADLDSTQFGLHWTLAGGDDGGELHGGLRVLKGLATRGDTLPGWKWSGAGRRHAYLVPREDAAGAEARRWLAEHQPGPETNLWAAMDAHGLPRNDLRHDGTYALPEVLEHNDRLWAAYKGRPGHVEYLVLAREPRDCTWPPCTEHQFLAAKHAMLAAEETTQAAQTGQAVPA